MYTTLIEAVTLPKKIIKKITITPFEYKSTEKRTFILICNFI